jgi:hypothetical protein
MKRLSQTPLQLKEPGVVKANINDHFSANILV